MGVDENGKEIGGNQWLAEFINRATWTHVNLIKKGIEASGWKSKDDNLKMIEAMEGMKLEESDDFPQGFIDHPPPGSPRRSLTFT